MEAIGSVDIYRRDGAKLRRRLLVLNAMKRRACLTDPTDGPRPKLGEPVRSHRLADRVLTASSKLAKTTASRHDLDDTYFFHD